MSILKILKYNEISSKRTSRVKANVSKLVFGKAAVTGTWPGAAASERTVTRAQRSHSFRQQEKNLLSYKNRKYKSDLYGPRPMSLSQDWRLVETYLM